MNYCPLCSNALESRVVDGVSRLACPSIDCRFVHWDNPIPVVAGLVGFDGGYVLARNASWPKTMYSLITGFLETGEPPEKAIVRELSEELGLRVKRCDFIGHFPLPRFNQLLIAYFVDAEGNLKLGEEICDVKLVARDELSCFDFGPLTLTREIVDRWLSAQ